MKFLFILFCFFCSRLDIIGQFYNFSNAISTGTAGATMAAGNEYCGMGNPACLAECQNLLIGIHYQNRFMLTELGDQTLDLIYPVNRGSFAGHIAHYGTRALNQLKFTLSYGHFFNSWLCAGIDLNYHRTYIQTFQENRSLITGNIGILVQPLPGLRVGCYCINLTRSSHLFKVGEVAGTTLRWGASYTRKKRYLIAADFCWTDLQDLDLALGAEIFMAEHLVIRGGVRLPSCVSYSFGVGILLDRMQFNAGFNRHLILGLSTAISLIIPLHAKSKE